MDINFQDRIDEYLLHPDRLSFVEEFGQYVLPETIVHILNRKSPNVTCYALRRELNLRISSNQVEKANDFVVATRQKHI